MVKRISKLTHTHSSRQRLLFILLVPALLCSACASTDIVHFKQASFSGFYEWPVITFIAVSVLEMLLIAGLLISRARRQRAEKESHRLAEARHKKLEEFLASIPGVVWESRLVGDDDPAKLQFVSNYTEKLLGYSVEEWMSTPGLVQSIVPEEDHEEFARQREAILTSGKEGHIEFRWRAKDGRMLWAVAHVTPILGEAGAIVGLRGVTLDVTERKLAEEGLRQSEERLRRAQRAARVSTWEWKLSTGESIWSEEMYELLGLEQGNGSVRLEDFVACIHPEDREQALASAELAIKEGKDYYNEFRILRPDGALLWLSSRGRVIRDASGKPEWMIGVNIDITDRKQGEEALRRSTQRHLDVLRALPDLLFIHSLEGDYLDYYAGDARGLYVPPHQFLGKNIRDVLPAEVAEAILSCFRRARETGELQIFEFMLPMPDEPRSFEARISYTNDGQILSIVRDITERQKAERAVKESEANYRAIFNGMNAAIFVLDKDNVEVIEVNRRMLELYGFTAEEVRHLRARDVSADEPPYTPDAALQLIRKAAAGEPQHFEWLSKDKSGRRFWVEASLIHITIAGKECVIVMASDITNRKRAEEARQEAFVQVSELKAQLEAENIYLKEEIRLDHSFNEIIGESDQIKKVLFEIEQVAPTDTTVLILGETGCGKELVARAIHRTSLRKDKPLVKVNCAALPATLIESELFGYEKGAFSGAIARQRGRFELADGGTILLDEIGDLPLESQSKLLRVLEEGEFERLGSGKTIKVEVRVIAATNRNLPLEVKKGRFREDLWYRLHVFPITVPPLRERKEDIPLLVKAFVQKFSRQMGKTIDMITPATMRALNDYSWPGNIRELANMIERAVINSDSHVLRLADPLKKPEAIELPLNRPTLEDMERQYILQVLKECDWRIEGPKGAARILELNPSTLRTRMAKLGLVKSENGA